MTGETGGRAKDSGRNPLASGTAAAVRAVCTRRSVRLAAALAAVAFVGWIYAPHADAQSVVNGMAEEWRRASLIWAGRLVRNAQRLFVLLAGFEVVASAMILLLKPRKLDEAAGGFVLKILVMSLCFFAITSFELVVPRLFDSFVVAGQTATLVPSLNPAQVAGLGILMAGKILAGSVLGSPMLNVQFFAISLVCAMLVALAFAGIACQMVYTLVEGYVVMSAGVFFLGFASFRGTAAMADNYLMYVVHVGIKMFMLYLLVPIGVTITSQFPDLTLANMLDPSAPLEMVVSSCIFCGLVMFLPGAFASRITGGASLGIAQALRNN